MFSCNVLNILHLNTLFKPYTCFLFALKKKQSSFYASHFTHRAVKKNAKTDVQDSGFSFTIYKPTK